MHNNFFYNIIFVNSKPRLANSRVDITQRQHGKFLAALLLSSLRYITYETSVKQFFCIDIQLHQHSLKLEKLEIV